MVVTLDRCVYEHRNDCKNATTKRNPTALVEHKLRTGYNLNLANTQIIGRQSNYRKRLLHKTVAITQEKHSINKQTNIENLSASYINIINYHLKGKNTTKS